VKLTLKGVMTVSRSARLFIIAVCWLRFLATGALVFTAVAAVLWFDLSLGPNFLSAYAKAHGKTGFLVTVLPWILSVCTTGFQYFTKMAASDKKFRAATIGGKIALSVGVLIAVADVLTDVGGYTSSYFGVRQGLNIVPDVVSAPWVVFALMIAVFCGLQEFILPKGIEAAGREAATSVLPGAFFLKAGWFLSHLLFEGVRQAAMVAAALGAIALDVVSSAYFVQEWLKSSGTPMSRNATALAWGVSIIMFILQMFLIWHVRHNKIHLTAASLGWVLGIGGLVALDTAMDVAGFTTLMYGPHQKHLFWPDHPGLAWFLIAMIIASISAASEPLIRIAYSSVEGKVLNTHVTKHPGKTPPKKVAPAAPGAPGAAGPQAPPGTPPMPTLSPDMQKRFPGS
jgi:hypothetical protein